MVGYYKVHRNNFDSFIAFLLRKYKDFQNYDLNDFKPYYNNSDYLYLCIQYHYSYNKFIMTYMNYSLESAEWYKRNSVSYCGEYHARREKLERLDKLSRMSGKK